MTTEEQIVLESLLIRTTEMLAGYRREYPELLNTASFHFSPDSAWISNEHEVLSTEHANGQNNVTVIRKSPACHEILLKI